MKLHNAVPLAFVLLSVGVHSYVRQEVLSARNLRSTSQEDFEQLFHLNEHDSHHQDPSHGKHAEEHGHHGTKHDHHEEEHGQHAAEHGHHNEAHHGEEHGHHDEAHHGEEHGHHGGDHNGEAFDHGGNPVYHHEIGSPESFALACFLMGGVGALMFVFYLVHSKHLRTATWRVMNMTVSIFIAVLIYATLKMVIVEYFKPNFYELIAITLVSFVFLFVGTHALLFKLMRGDPEQLRAVGTLMAHITGFAAMYGFADCREVEYFEELSGTGIVLLICTTCTTIGLLCYIMNRLMKDTARAVGEDGEANEIDEQEERWIEICSETDDDVFCLATSFLLVLYIRYVIRGTVMPYEPGKVGFIEQIHATKLLMVAAFFGALVVFGQVMIIKYSDVLGANEFDKRCTENLQHLNSMTMAWCVLFWAEWQLYVSGWESTVIGGCLVIAVCLTILSFAGVVVFTFVKEHLHQRLAKRAIGSLELALGVLAGFSWERAFDVGFEEIEHAFTHHIETPMAPHVAVTVLSIILLMIVLPAWRYHILPKTMRLEEAEEKATAREEAREEQEAAMKR